MNIVSWIPPVQDWFSKTFPTIDIRWVNLAFILIFILVMYWILHELYKRLEESENKKPSITVVASSENEEFYLEVTNNGEKGTFEADAYFIRDKRSTIGEKYCPIWEKTSTNKSEILHGLSDKIKIASIRLTQTENFFELYGYDVAKSVTRTIKSVKYNQLITKGITPNFIIQINISSVPSLKEGVFVGAYDVSLSGIYPTKIQSKLVPITAKFIETNTKPND